MAISDVGVWGSAGDDALSEIARARIIEYADRTLRIAPLCTIDNTSGTRALVHKVNQWKDFASFPETITDGADFDSTDTLDVSSVALTPSVTGMLCEVTDLLASSTPFAGLDPFIQQMAAAVAEELDDDLAGLFDTLTNLAGTTNVELSLAGFLDALVNVQSNQAVGPVRAVLHPRQAADLGLSVGGFVSSGATNTFAGAGNLAGTGTAAIMDGLGNTPSNGLAGFVAGVPVYTSARVIDTGTDFDGAMFTPDTFTVAMKWGMRTEMDRDLPGVSTVLLANMAYAVGVTADNHGSKITSRDLP